MTFARILLKLWRLRRWVAVGVLVAVVSAIGSVATSHSTVYASASTQLLVDSPHSALANASTDLTGYLNRASAYARMMTSTAALQYIGKAAGIPGSEIDATGPIEINGLPSLTHAPVAIVNGQDVAAPAIYKLSFVQNPSLPTVEVYADAPTTKQAIALANGAVTGFARFIDQLGATDGSQSQRVEIRQLGQATGGMVDASASKSIAFLVFGAVLALWCCMALLASRVRANLRAVKQGDVEDRNPLVPESPFPTTAPLVGSDLAQFASTVNAQETDTVTNGSVNGAASHRVWATTRFEKP